MNSPVNPWPRRIERAQVLEREHPAAAELLRFYRTIAAFQKTVAQALVLAASRLVSTRSLPEPLRPHIQPLLTLLQQKAPPPLADAAAVLSLTDDWDPADPAPRFVTRVLLQPYMEAQARRASAAPCSPGSTCPFCNESPVAAILRPEGEGGKRSLLCSLCFTEWDFRRLLCPNCGEEDHQKLPVYTAEQFPHIRIEACDTCHTYLKSIDLTRNGLAVPEVDELAALPLDLWAAKNHYIKLQPNLFGL
ncbi:formate dehydrogenase formation protein FdhE [Candidatus Sulfopaludibacter sp. SbA6]|nr:formate dehydrogenase formation protein FdhE [Candidatus Sulfopaludibacter sp. SbA6]